jgi:hypothetical protein
MIMVADLDSGNGKTYREINNAMKHKITIGSLVEIDCGARLYVLKHNRDCDGTPLYVIGLKDSNIIKGGYTEECLKVINNTPTADKNQINAEQKALNDFVDLNMVY